MARLLPTGRGALGVAGALLLSGCIPSEGGPARSASAADIAGPDRSAASGPRLATDLGALEAVGGAVEAPTWKAVRVRADAREVPTGVYTVRAGDTLRGIANRTGAGSQMIAAANDLVAPYVIRPGQKLSIPGGRYHRVDGGETGIGIAQAYGVAWRDVVAINRLDEPYVLRVGQKLLLPGGAEPAAFAKAGAPRPDRRPTEAMTIEQRAAAFDLDIDDILTGSEPAFARRGNVEPSLGGALPSRWRREVLEDAPPARATIEVPADFAGRFNWPVAGKLVSSFGSKGGGRVNDGINIAVPAGTPVQAAAPGTVAYAGDEIGVFGGLVLINHGDGWITAYGHASELKVRRGDKVAMGDIIALAGESGYVQEPQVHFEIRKNRKPVDPVRELPDRT